MCLSKRKDAGKCIRSAFNALELRCHKKTELKPFYKKEPLKLKGSPETWWCEKGDTKKQVFRNQNFERATPGHLTDTPSE